MTLTPAMLRMLRSVERASAETFGSYACSNGRGWPTLDALERRGLVDAHRNDWSNMNTRWTITEAGRTALSEIVS